MYYHFQDEEGNEMPSTSFEVFYSSWEPEDLGKRNPGFYWWSCYPGCLPDSEEATGPFPTEAEALADAREY